MTAYDLIADDYEKFFDKESYAEEDLELSKMLPNPEGLRVVDIGCGTGLGYNLLKRKILWKSFSYLGIDPSEKMLDKFALKTVDLQVEWMQTTFEHFKSSEKFDLAISTYGSVSYVKPKSMKKLRTILNKGGRFFLVFYKDDYRPITHEVFKDKVEMHNFKFSEYKPYLKKVSKDVHFKEWHNYIIAEGTV